MEKRLKDVLEDMVDERYYLKPSQVEAILKHCDKKISEGCGFKPQFIERDGVSAAITAKYGLRQTDPLYVEQVGFNVDSDGCSRTIVAHYAQAGSLDFRTKEAGNPTPHTCALEFRISTQSSTEGLHSIQVGTLYNKSQNPINGRIYDVNGIAPCLRTPTGGLSEPKIIQMPHGFFGGDVKYIPPAIISSAFADNNYLLVESRIRKLTERECFRLMGLCDADIDKILNAEEEVTLKSGKKKTRRAISKTDCYDLAGNSIVVDVLEYIFENLFINKAVPSDGRQLTLF